MKTLENASEKLNILSSGNDTNSTTNEDKESSKSEEKKKSINFNV